MRLRKFSIRSLLVLAALIAALLAAGQYKMQLKNQMVAEHYNAMKFGFEAIECQRPRDNPDWLANFNKTKYSSQHHYRDWLSGINFDREALEQSHELWANSINHASLRDYFRKRESAPWNFFMTPPTPRELPPLPDSDIELKDWWFENIEPFVKTEELNNEFFTTCDRDETMEFNCEIINHVSATGGKTAIQKWFALRDIVGPEQD